MNSILFATNTMPQALVAGQNINFGQPIRRYGKNIQLSGGNVVLNGEGYYVATANVSYVTGAAGTYTLQLFENGVAIPGAEATLTAVANIEVAQEVQAVVRIKCCEEKVITASISGGDPTVDNANIIVFKA